MASEDELPPANLILQALHAIKGSIDQTNLRVDALALEVRATNARLDQTNARLDQTNEQLQNLRIVTVQKLTDLNAKVDETNTRLEETNTRLGRLEASHDLLNERFDHFLGGEGAQLVRRVTKVEVELEMVKAKLHT